MGSGVGLIGGVLGLLNIWPNINPGETSLISSLVPLTKSAYKEVTSERGANWEGRSGAVTSSYRIVYALPILRPLLIRPRASYQEEPVPTSPGKLAYVGRKLVQLKLSKTLTTPPRGRGVRRFVTLLGVEVLSKHFPLHAPDPQRRPLW